MRNMVGTEKKVLGMAGAPSYPGCSGAGMKSARLSVWAVPPPIPMSPIVEKMEGLKAIRNRSNSLRLGRLAFYRHLEKVETMRCFWELKHVELEGKDDKKQVLKNLKSQKKRSPPDSPDPLVEPLRPEQVENAEGGAELIQQNDSKKTLSESEDDEEVVVFEDSEEESKSRPQQVLGGPGEEDHRGPAEQEEDQEAPQEKYESSTGAQEAESQTAVCVRSGSKRRVTEEDLETEDLKKSRVEGEEEEPPEDTADKEFFIDSSPPPLAPFDHRIVTPKPHQIASYYTINRDEVLGGGRFGQVHKCMEKSSGLTLAAKIIKAKSPKEKDVVRNEIQVMNQLDHSNLIQLYAAFESRHDIILVMEYVEGGELFDRIIDENYNLTELDTVLFIRQICEGLQYMHKMYILHLDLKPENILCVSRATNKIKIIDFGLARRYKPREKLRVNFGTPEFLAPEVINYEFVSFPTDMWSLGVIAYMLLSGLSPFLGDDDNETLNNILACQWNFEEEEFADVSDQAKDFITLLLVKSKSWRMSASESLRHPWLSDANLHYRLNLKKNRCHSARTSSTES
ncbi:myosin light chain kinase family member 4-like [Synchiropus splendidus]|uniref:myosin light chain kinase family member 4-like n=1 Tax=Synchiropus splendidus TaxID=270530 RepID=UPI00237D5905|nr:myosin light chain kinase family member 4-like [Synchiropus splendidus]